MRIEENLNGEKEKHGRGLVVANTTALLIPGLYPKDPVGHKSCVKDVLFAPFLFLGLPVFLIFHFSRDSSPGSEDQYIVLDMDMDIVHWTWTWRVKVRMVILHERSVVIFSETRLLTPV